MKTLKIRTTKKFSNSIDTIPEDSEIEVRMIYANHKYVGFDLAGLVEEGKKDPDSQYPDFPVIPYLYVTTPEYKGFLISYVDNKLKIKDYKVLSSKEELTDFEQYYGVVSNGDRKFDLVYIIDVDQALQK